jgi:predicted nucleic acid-binding protein
MDYILDSSIIVKWFSRMEETNHEDALKILQLYRDERINIFIPDLAIYEVSNALRYNKNFNQEEVSRLMKALLGLELEIINLSNIIIIEALGIAYKDNITVYDSVFIALSNLMELTLITANPKHQSSKKEGRRILMLADF